mgnify:CR=1 FL=1
MNAVIYARYSSHNQTEQSIEGQLHDNYAWAEQQGITVIAEYIDRALTGTKDDRPDFQRMIADAAKKQFEMVIVWKLDRFARNRYDSAIYKARLKKYGVRVVSVKENITDSPEGIILEGLLESMAEYYSANLSQNVKRGIRESIAKGHFVGGHVPIGYKRQDFKLVVDDKAAPVVRLVFERYAVGVSKTDIVNELHERGYRQRNGTPFTVKCFRRMLTNPVYIGKYICKHGEVDCVSAPLVDEETFQKVQERIRLTARMPAANKAKVDYLLRGKVFCGLCGAPMIGECGRSKTGNMYHYYACSGKKNKHTRCKKKNEKKDFIEWYVVEQTAAYVLTPDRISKIAVAVAKEYEKEFSDSRVKDAEKALVQMEREMDKLIDMMLDVPKSAQRRITERMEALEAQQNDVRNEIAKLRIAKGIPLTEKEVRAWLKKYCDGDLFDMEYRRRIIDTFINAIYLYDDRIIIFYNIRGGKQVSYMDLIDSAELPEEKEGSILNPLTRASGTKIELWPKFIFVNGTFGCVFPRPE